MILRARHHTWTYPRSPDVMGIVNVNGDSFSGDGTLDVAKALGTAREMVSQGATVIDVGAESARTDREVISVAEEVDRLAPFVQGFAGEALLSLNTWRPEVVRQILPLGGDLLNDIGALPTPENAELCAKYGAALLVMHSVGLPKVAHTSQRYDDIMQTLGTFFEEKIALCLQAGLTRDHLVIDPGIDFAKQRDDNLTIFRELETLHRFGRPILLPVSRKTVIGEVLGIGNPAARDAGTVACIAAGIRNGAHIFRTHNVPAAVETLKVLSAVFRPDDAATGTVAPLE